MTLSEMRERGHEQVSYFYDDDTGLQTIIAIYDTRLGPAVGGTRIWDYDDEGDALRDALRLSQAMAHKTATAGLDLGGGKAVILGDPEEVKTPELLREYGRVVDEFGGRFITGEDVNVDTEDLKTIEEETPYVGGQDIGYGAEVTAHGVIHGMRACLDEVHGTDTLDGVDVVVQGCGKVGSALVEELVDEGAIVTVADLDSEKVDRLVDTHGVDSVPPEDVYAMSCDVFAPCALGGVINDDTVPQLDCDIVAGSANNVLEERRHGEALHERDILYAPDYVVNAGGLIAGFVEAWGGTREDAIAKVEEVRDRMERVIKIADDGGITTVTAADRYAERRMVEAED